MRRAVLAIVLAVSTLALGAPRSARCTPAIEIDVAETLRVDGAELHLLVRGADRSAPILLWLHGGPGGAERPLFRYFNGGLERHFVVAYLDQRGAGRSFDPDADPRALTVARHLADLDTVVDHLRRTLGAPTLVLVLYAHAHPEKVRALLAVSPLVATRRQQEAQAAWVHAEALRRGDDATLARWREIGPAPHATAADVLAMERLADRYGAVYHEPPDRAWVVVRGVLGGLVTPWEIPRLIRGNQVSLEAMHDELLDLDLFTAVPRVEVPVVFLLGRHDHHVSAEISAAYLDALRAPWKRTVWFERSAHNPPFEEPERFDAAVVSELEALGVGRSQR
jgi:pimeloyl-ACP methyl ester carboxylesterase